MEHYVGLDISLKLTAICIVDQTGKVVREDMVPSDPEAIAGFVQSHAPHVARVGLETGATSPLLRSELTELGLPVICIALSNLCGQRYPLTDATSSSSNLHHWLISLGMMVQTPYSVQMQPSLSTLG